MWAVFVDDGLDSVFGDRDSAKAYAAETRTSLRAEGRKDSCFVKKMTKEEERMFGGLCQKPRRPGPRYN